MNLIDNVAVTSRSFSRHPILRQELLSKYAKVSFNVDGIKLAGKELVEFLNGHSKAITALETIDRDLLGQLPDLKVISKYGVGVDMIDMTALREHSIAFGYTGGVNRRSVSELTIACAISLLRHIPQAHSETKNGTWQQIVGNQLSDQVVGIIGCGHIGKDLAVLLRAFGCKVLANDILDFPDFYREHGVVPLTLDDLLQQADIVTLHVPLDESTLNLLSKKKLQLMKPSALLINHARGGLLDETALKFMLMEGRLAGAALDVFNQEPPKDLELLNLPNVLTTPHLGGSAEEGILAMGRAAIRGLDENTIP